MNKKRQIQNKPIMRKIILEAVFVLSGIIALVFMSLRWEPKPDPASEMIIRQFASWELKRENIDKGPDAITNEDFAKIIKLTIDWDATGNTDFAALTPEAALSSSLELYDLQLLEKFKNLQSLTLSNLWYPNSAIPKWMKISAKYGIIDLDEKCTIDLKPLKNLKDLKTLHLCRAPFKNIKPLRFLNNIEKLDLSNTLVSDIKPLTNMTELKYLYGNDTKISNIEPLKGLNKLEVLYLDGTKILNLKHINNLKNLGQLSISRTKISNLEPLKQLINLERLYIDKCPNISDEQVEGLKKALPNLHIYK